DRNGKILKLEKDQVDFRNRAVQAEISLNTALQKNEGLMRIVEDLKRQNYEAKNTTTPNAPRPSAVEVKGEVLEVAGNFATISLGRNHELKEGDVLQVYRLAPTPVYLGTL